MLHKFIVSSSSIQHKILISLISITVLSLFFFGYISLYLSKKSLTEQVRLSKMQNLELVTEKLNILVDNMESLSNVYFGNSELRFLLMSPTIQGSYEQRVKKEFINRMIVNYKYAFTWLDYHVSIFGFNGVELHSIYEGNIGLNHITGQPWYPEVERQDGSVYFFYDTSSALKEVIGEDHYITVVRMLKDYESDRNIGLLMVSVKESFIYHQIKSSIHDYETIMITDEAGTILTASDKSLLGVNVKNSIYDIGLNSMRQQSAPVEINGRKFLANDYYMPKTSWNFIILSPYERLFENINGVQWNNWIVFCIIIILCIFLSYIISRRLSIPIKALCLEMKKVEKGDLSVRSEIISRDEIGSLSLQFNRMVSRIQQLHSEVIIQAEEKRRAELEALQSQINTHFLFNTLASVRYMVVTGDAQQADSVIVSLVKLLRETFSRKSEFVFIREEVDLLMHYLNIQRARLTDSFQIKWELEEDILQFRTLNFLLQPIVENALFHGIEPLKETGLIVIKGYRTDSSIFIEIIDNGIGFDKDGKKVHVQGMGTGLQNIRGRLEMHFGLHYSLSIERVDDTFTKVRLSFPVFRNEKELRSGEHHISR